MKDVIDFLKQRRTVLELDENYAPQYRLGYMKAADDAINYINRREKEALELLSKHWQKSTGMPLDECTAEHLRYAVDAIREALSRSERF